MLVLVLDYSFVWLYVIIFEIGLNQIKTKQRHFIFYSWSSVDRSSRPKVFCEKGVLKFSQNSQENTCVFFNKDFINKKRFQYRCFPVNFVKFLATSFLQNTFGGCFWPETLGLLLFLELERKRNYLTRFLV